MIHELAKVLLLARGVVVTPALCYIQHLESWPNVARARLNVADGQDPKWHEAEERKTEKKKRCTYY